MYQDPSYYHLTEDAFKDTTVLDAGCGNTGYLQVVLHRLGVARITCLDIGSEWISPLQDVMEKHSVPSEKLTYVPGGTDNLPFDDDAFDLVFSNGVLPHLNDV